jgi:peptidoglycan/xylan/chitin deacetylase (PgdA/CDA1 family)
MLPPWIARTGPIRVPVPRAALRPAAAGLAAVVTPEGRALLVDAEGRPALDLHRLEWSLAAEEPFPAVPGRHPARIPGPARHALARLDHRARRLLLRAPRPAYSVSADAVGFLARRTAGTAGVFPWPDGATAGFVVTHDVEQSRERQTLELAEAEAGLGIRATYFIIPARLRRPELCDRLRELGHEVACHGLDHSGAEAHAPVAAFRAAADRLGLVAPFGYRSPHFACAPSHSARIGAVFRYDSSRPDIRPGARGGRPLGCGTIFPFTEREGLMQLAVTLPTDLELLDEGYDWRQVRTAWRAKWRWIKEGKGLGLLCTHIPAPGGSREVVPFLEEVIGGDRTWVGTAGELASFLVSRSSGQPVLRPWMAVSDAPARSLPLAVRSHR